MSSHALACGATTRTCAPTWPRRRLFELNRPEWPYVFFGAVASFVAGLQHPALAFSEWGWGAEVLSQERGHSA